MGKLGVKPKYVYTYKGRTKSRNAWGLDTECVVAPACFYRRMASGKMTFEKALKTPSIERHHITAWGETKNSVQWEKDQRAEVNHKTIVNRLKSKTHIWTPEEAISTPSRIIHIEALGEIKTARGWTLDFRCFPKCSKNLIKRIFVMGMSPEDAILLPDQSRRAKSIKITAFGVTKTNCAWAKDSRAVVSNTCIKNRIEQGWNAEKAITTPNDYHFVYLTILGERKSMSAWGKDSRCAVAYNTFISRICYLKHWSLEACLLMPANVDYEWYEREKISPTALNNKINILKFITRQD